MEPSSADSQHPTPELRMQRVEYFYTLLKVFARIELYFFIVVFLIYLVNVSFSWKIDTDGVEKLNSTVQTTLLMCGKNPLDPRRQKIIQDTLNKKMAALHFQPIALSNLLVPYSAYDSSMNVGNLTITPLQISRLEGASSWQKQDMESLISNFSYDPVGPYFYQFITQGAFKGSFQMKLLYFLFFLLSLIFLTQGLYYYHNIVKQREQQLLQEELRKKATEGDQASPVWDLAQVTLNKYYNRNLSQNNWIFYVSVTVMIAGFCLVVYGISAAYKSANNVLVTMVSASSGVIVQFIGATFLVIYNSTITQAVQYTAALQKVSTIGTSIKILESITDDGTEAMKNDPNFITMMNQARIDIAKLLIDQSKP